MSSLRTPRTAGLDPRPALDRLFRPASVAVVGATDNLSGYAGQTLQTMLAHTPPGALHLVNPRRPRVGSIDCVPQLSDVEEPIDLAVIVVPAEGVNPVLEECAALGVPFAYVLSAGFGEACTPRGLELQQELTRTLDRLAPDLRVVGPNGQGLYDVSSDFAFGFSPLVVAPHGSARFSRPGNIAVISQSGGVGNGLVSQGIARGLGFSRVVSTGNESDLGSLDFAAHCLACDDTDVVFMYLEGAPDGDRLRVLAAQASETHKALVVMKPGRSATVRDAIRSHTGNVAGPADLYSALFERLGVVEVRDSAEALDVLMLLSHHRRVTGERLGIVSGSGGAGVWLAEAAESGGLQVPQFSDDEQRRLGEHLPAGAAVRNPVDATASGSSQASWLSGLLEEMSTFSTIDLLACVVPLSNDELLPHLEPLLAVSGPEVPLVVFGHYQPTPAGIQQLADAGLPWFSSQAGLARAVRAVSLVSRSASAAAVEQSAPDVVPLDVTADLSEGQLKKWLDANGVPVPRLELVHSADAAVACLERWGTEVVLKVHSPGLAHKSDVGGVHLALADAAQVKAAFESIVALTLNEAPQALVEEMVGAGRELLLGALVDPDLGPFVVLGSGGVDADLGLDKVIRPAPVSLDEAFDMVRSLRQFPALGPWRGQPARDVARLAEVVWRVSVLVAAHQDVVRELELNPVIVHAEGSGVHVVDALATPR